MPLRALLPLLLCYLAGVIPLAHSQWVRWTKEHQTCTLHLGQSLDSALCEDMPYVRYFQEILAKPAEDGAASYHRSVSSAVMSLYSDLVELKRPMLLVDLSYEHAYLREIPEIMQSRAKATGRPLSSLFTTSAPIDAAFAPNERHVLVHPISFAIPEENIAETLPPKTKPFGRVIPGITSTYFHLLNESLYFQDMQKSMYAITYKKGGWDCLRHCEILAAGALPLFVHIKHSPVQTLSLHPKKLYGLLFHQPGLSLKAVRTGQMTMRFDELSLDLGKVDKQLYSALTLAMLHYTRNVFSTTAMAQHVLDTMYEFSNGHIKSRLPRRLLYLTHQDHDMDKGDYLTDFVLHGLKRLLGNSGVTDFPSRDGLYKTLSAFNESEYLQQRAKLYGAGFTWGMKLNHLDDKLERDFNQIKQNIVNHHYDIIILGSGHRDGWAARLHFWDLVCKHYHPLEVGYLDGADYHLRTKALNKYTPCAGHLFSREGYVP